ncbi:hypothetical protein L228DRAFT_245806 [Xylona heveae TC161]|uniref:Uncharacterized protein n=1 Tax=Xylona heveae (strain CBS 132557 / TC161) TaxID=1328760 RepID=A0A165IER9_XYLHT|nr:hypothetical protein L228DRAFT_245806 [Xylona heveae TC161]KZF24791.1 hypothetical protein L228DRAFT_245806 [Xylona heveae TC161]
MWWSNNEQRRQQKEIIKNIIKRTKQTEKSTQVGPRGLESPPDLTHSLPASSDTYSDAMSRTRAVSLDSQFSLDCEFGQGMGMEHFDGFSASMPPPLFAPYHGFPPYEVDVKTERQMFVNDIPTRRDSSVSTFSTFQHPAGSLPFQPHSTGENWVCEDIYEAQQDAFAEEPIDFNFFDFPYSHLTPTRSSFIDIEDCDRPLLDHFLENVLRLIFPILEVNQHGSARSNVILPALEANKCYLHCCLSVSALHLKATEQMEGEKIDNDIMRHRYATISELCEALSRDTDHRQILEATLGMIFFQCSVGRPDDCLPDIPWHQHFQAASNLILKLDLPRILLELSFTHAQPPFNMTLAAWIDILGATMLGRAPIFADTYREKHISASSTGLCELMGCEDRVMYLISEIACLEGLKLGNMMDDVTLCQHISALAEQIGINEPAPNTITSPFSASGAIRPKQLSRNMTAIFCLAARIYLISLIPTFDRNAKSTTDLVTRLTDYLQYIPSGAEGFDRSLVWPLLICGSFSVPNSPFRGTFTDRVERLGEHAAFGSFGRMVRLIQEVWRRGDESAAASPENGAQCVHWRDVMQQNGWDYLLL